MTLASVMKLIILISLPHPNGICFAAHFGHSSGSPSHPFLMCREANAIGVHPRHLGEEIFFGR